MGRPAMPGNLPADLHPPLQDHGQAKFGYVSMTMWRIGYVNRLAGLAEWKC